MGRIIDMYERIFLTKYEKEEMCDAEAEIVIGKRLYQTGMSVWAAGALANLAVVATASESATLNALLAAGGVVVAAHYANKAGKLSEKQKSFKRER